MTPEDRKFRRAARRAAMLQDADQRRTWAGNAAVIPNKKRQADKRACRDWRY